MPHIMNTLDKPVNVKVYGNWFSFQPKQIKYIANEGVAYKMNTDLGEEGLVAFPEEAMEMDKQSAEFRRIQSEVVKAGVFKRIKKLKEIIYNLEVSLQKDIDLKGLKTDVAAFASDGELQAYRELSVLQGYEQSEQQKRADEFKKLRETVSGNTNGANSGAPNSRSPNASKPTQG